MIEEIFIIGKDGKVVYGDALRYPKEAIYPVDEINGTRLIQVQINDIRLCILYRLMSDVLVLGYIQKLRTRMERRLGMINHQNILSNYFLLFKMLNKKENVVVIEEKKSLIPLISNKNGYLDVVECSNVVIDGDRVVSHRINGRCYLSTVFDEMKNMRIVMSKPNTYEVVYRSNEMINDRLNEIEINARNKDGRNEVFGYLVCEGDEPLIRIQKIEDGYELRCREQMKFDHLEICFPIPMMACKVMKTHRLGKSVYDEKNGVLRWTLTNEMIVKEKIELRVELFEECEDTRAIEVNFNIKEWNGTKMKLKSAECVDDSGVCFWVRYSIYSGRYEIR